MEEIEYSNAALFRRLLDRSGLTVDTKRDFIRMKAPGYMDLCIDRLMKTSDGNIRFSLAHNGRQNGDLMADPDMEVIWVPGPIPALQAQTFQNDFAGVYQNIEHPRVNREHLARSLNSFLNLWLRNLLEQGHFWDGTND